MLIKTTLYIINVLFFVYLWGKVYIRTMITKRYIRNVYQTGVYHLGGRCLFAPFLPRLTFFY